MFFESQSIRRRDKMLNKSDKKITRVNYAALLLVLCAYNIIFGETWERVLSYESISAASSGVMLNGIAYGNGSYVAVGDNGQKAGGAGMFTSTDGKQWTGRNNPWVSTRLKGVKFLDGKFYAYGGCWDTAQSSETYGQYLEKIWRSDNGSDWGVVFSEVSSSSTPDIRALAYGNETFIAGSGYNIWYSNNLQSWSCKPSDEGSPDIHYTDIAFGNGIFVATGYHVSEPRVYTSTDGINWEIQQEDTDGGGLPADFVRFVNSHFIIGLSSGGGAMKISGDGKQWLDIYHGRGSGIAYGNGGYVITDEIAGNPPGAILYSTNLTDNMARVWYDHGTSEVMSLKDVASGAGGFVAVGNPGIYYCSFDDMIQYPAIIGEDTILLNVGVPFQYSVEVVNFAPVQIYRQSLFNGTGFDLPPGVTQNTSSPHYSGTPTTAGEWSVMLYATEDNTGNRLYAKRKLTFLVSSPVPISRMQTNPREKTGLSLSSKGIQRGIYFNTKPIDCLIVIYNLKGEKIRALHVSSGQTFWDGSIPGGFVSSGSYFAVMKTNKGDLVHRFLF